MPSMAKLRQVFSRLKHDASDIPDSTPIYFCAHCSKTESSVSLCSHSMEGMKNAGYQSEEHLKSPIIQFINDSSSSSSSSPQKVIETQAEIHRSPSARGYLQRDTETRNSVSMREVGKATATGPNCCVQNDASCFDNIDGASSVSLISNESDNAEEVHKRQGLSLPRRTRRSVCNLRMKTEAKIEAVGGSKIASSQCVAPGSSGVNGDISRTSSCIQDPTTDDTSSIAEVTRYNRELMKSMLTDAPERESNGQPTRGKMLKGMKNDCDQSEEHLKSRITQFINNSSSSSSSSPQHVIETQAKIHRSPSAIISPGRLIVALTETLPTIFPHVPRLKETFAKLAEKICSSDTSCGTCDFEVKTMMLMVEKLLLLIYLRDNSEEIVRAIHHHLQYLLAMKFTCDEESQNSHSDAAGNESDNTLSASENLSDSMDDRISSVSDNGFRNRRSPIGKSSSSDSPINTARLNPSPDIDYLRIAYLQSVSESLNSIPVVVGEAATSHSATNEARCPEANVGGHLQSDTDSQNSVSLREVGKAIAAGPNCCVQNGASCFDNIDSASSVSLISNESDNAEEIHKRQGLRLPSRISKSVSYKFTCDEESQNSHSDAAGNESDNTLSASDNLSDSMEDRISFVSGIGFRNRRSPIGKWSSSDSPINTARLNPSPDIDYLRIAYLQSVSESLNSVPVVFGEDATSHSVKNGARCPEANVGGYRQSDTDSQNSVSLRELGKAIAAGPNCCVQNGASCFDNIDSASSVSLISNESDNAEEVHKRQGLRIPRRISKSVSYLRNETEAKIEAVGGSNIPSSQCVASGSSGVNGDISRTSSCTKTERSASLSSHCMEGMKNDGYQSEEHLKSLNTQFIKDSSSSSSSSPQHVIETQAEIHRSPSAIISPGRVIVALTETLPTIFTHVPRLKETFAKLAEKIRSADTSCGTCDFEVKSMMLMVEKLLLLIYLRDNSEEIVRAIHHHLQYLLAMKFTCDSQNTHSDAAGNEGNNTLSDSMDDRISSVSGIGFRNRRSPIGKSSSSDSPINTARLNPSPDIDYLRIAYVQSVAESLISVPVVVGEAATSHSVKNGARCHEANVGGYLQSDTDSQNSVSLGEVGKATAAGPNCVQNSASCFDNIDSASSVSLISKESDNDEDNTLREYGDAGLRPFIRKGATRFDDSDDIEANVRGYLQSDTETRNSVSMREVRKATAAGNNCCVQNDASWFDNIDSASSVSLISNESDNAEEVHKRQGLRLPRRKSRSVSYLSMKTEAEIEAVGGSKIASSKWVASGSSGVNGDISGTSSCIQDPTADDTSSIAEVTSYHRESNDGQPTRVRKETMEVMLKNKGDGFGLGVSLRTVEGSNDLVVYIIHAVKPGSPAHEVGVLGVEDRIVAINQQGFFGLPMEDVIKLKDEAFLGPSLTLTIEFDVIDEQPKYGTFDVALNKKFKVGVRHKAKKKGAPWIVAIVERGGAAHRCGQLFAGDRILSSMQNVYEEMDQISSSYTRHLQETIFFKVQRDEPESVHEGLDQLASFINENSSHEGSASQRGRNFVVKRKSIRPGGNNEYLVCDQEVTLFRDAKFGDFGFLLRMDVEDGKAYVTNLRPNGPAQQSGVVKRSDRILKVNGRRVCPKESARDLIEKADHTLDLLLTRSHRLGHVV